MELNTALPIDRRVKLTGLQRDPRQGGAGDGRCASQDEETNADADDLAADSAFQRRSRCALALSPSLALSVCVCVCFSRLRLVCCCSNVFTPLAVNLRSRTRVCLLELSCMNSADLLLSIAGNRFQ